MAINNPYAFATKKTFSPNNEASYAIPNDLEALILHATGDAVILGWESGDPATGTEIMTLDSGAYLTLSAADLGGQTLYALGNSTSSVLEIGLKYRGGEN